MVRGVRDRTLATFRTGTPIERRYDLDWVRVAAFFLLVLYHVGMYYVSWDWLVVAATGYGFIVWYFHFSGYSDEAAPPPDALRTFQRVVWATFQWTAIAAIFGFVRGIAFTDSPALRYLREAVFRVYILHQTLIVVLAHNAGPAPGRRRPAAGAGEVRDELRRFRAGAAGALVASVVRVEEGESTPRQRTCRDASECNDTMKSEMK